MPFKLSKRSESESEDYEAAGNEMEITYVEV
jgi:hypothetical protein